MIQPVLLAAAAGLLCWTGNLVTLTHRYTKYGGTSSELVVECGLLRATSNGHGTAGPALGACGTLLENINTDDSQVYIAIDPAAAALATQLDLAAAGTAVALLVAVAVEVGSRGRRQLQAFVQQCYALAALAAWYALNCATRLTAALHAAPDPGAVSSGSVAFGVVALATLPLLALARLATKAALHED